jgi:predicted transcriptional regulator of viral defense system
MKSSRKKPLDWAKIVTGEARLTDVILVDEIAAKYKLPVASVWKALSRLEDRGFVSRVTKGVYANRLVRDHSAQWPLGTKYPEPGLFDLRNHR